MLMLMLVGLGLDDFVVGLSYAQIRLRFRHAPNWAGLDSTRYVFHSLRHGGATEAALGGMDLNMVAVRGRWKILSTAVHYIQQGEALLAEVRVPQPVRDRANVLARRWPFRVGG
jgi:hypothetical protein